MKRARILCGGRWCSWYSRREYANNILLYEEGCDEGWDILLTWPKQIWISVIYYITFFVSGFRIVWMQLENTTTQNVLLALTAPNCSETLRSSWKMVFHIVRLVRRNLTLLLLNYTYQKCMCFTDWNELFTTKCFACGFPVEAGDRWVEALNNNYHSQCFNCTVSTLFSNSVHS